MIVMLVSLSVNSAASSPESGELKPLKPVPRKADLLLNNFKALPTAFLVMRPVR